MERFRVTHYTMSDWSNPNLEVILPYIVKQDSDYLPLYTISRPDYRVFNAFLHGSTSDLDIPSKSYKYLNEYEDTYAYSQHIQRDKYENILNRNIYSQNIFALGRNYYIGRNKCLFYVDIESNSIVPMYLTCFKREHLKYVKQCILLEKDVHPDALTIFVNDQLDVMNSVYRLLRTQYRKYIKKTAIEAGVNIETVSNFDHLFERLELPKANTIDGYEEMLTNISNEFLYYEDGMNEDLPDGNSFKLTY